MRRHLRARILAWPGAGSASTGIDGPPGGRADARAGDLDRRASGRERPDGDADRPALDDRLLVGKRIDDDAGRERQRLLEIALLEREQEVGLGAAAGGR